MRRGAGNVFRSRRWSDPIRKQWYSAYRSFRFANRHRDRDQAWPLEMLIQRFRKNG